MLALAGAVHHAAHDRDPHVLHPLVALAPHSHALAQVPLDGLRKLAEERARRPPAAGTRGDQRSEGPKAHRLEQFLGDHHFARALSPGLRGKGDPDGVADPLLEEHREGRGGGHDPLRAHAGLGEAEMEGMVRAGS